MIREKILLILADYNIYNISIDDYTEFIEELNLDSLSVTEFITLLEKEFKIKIVNEEITPENFLNISCLEEFINKKINAD